jgi:hypothetical protein
LSHTKISGEVERLLRDYPQNQELVRNLGSRYYQVVYPTQVRQREKFGVSTREIDKKYSTKVSKEPGGPFLISSLGANFDPHGRLNPRGPGVNFVLYIGVELSLGVKFSVRPSILLNCRERSPLGAKFTPGARGEVKNGPLTSKPTITTCNDASILTRANPTIVSCNARVENICNATISVGSFIRRKIFFPTLKTS